MTNESGIPLLDLKAQYATLKSEIEPKLLKLFESQYFIMGPEVAEFEKSAAVYCGAVSAVGVSSGTDALLLALMTLDLKPGDEVITSPYTFFATAGSICRLGLTPVFVDIDPITYNLDVGKVGSRITAKSKVIMPVHLFGQCAEMDPIMDLAQRHNLYVIEDAAQAIGAEYNGRRAGSIGHFGAFSFFPSKNLGCFGDAGMVTTNDAALNDLLVTYRTHGSKKKYYHDFVGGNFRIDTLQAAVLQIKLRYLEKWTEGRRRNAELYRRYFSDSGILEERTCDNTPLLILPTELQGQRHIYNQFVIRTPHRDRLLSGLKSANIGCEVYYPLPLHQQVCFQNLGYKTGDFPQSERAAHETLALPIFPELGEERLVRVVSTVSNLLRSF